MRARVTAGGSGQPCDADEDCEAGEICTRREHPTVAEARVCGLPITPLAAYQLAANDYIARGGSGFDVLRRNTSQQNLGISLRDAVVDYLNLRPTCGEGVDPALGDMLYELGRRATDGESVDVGALVRGVGDAHEDYIACADPDSEIGSLPSRGACRNLDGDERSQCGDSRQRARVLMPCITRRPTTLGASSWARVTATAENENRMRKAGPFRRMALTGCTETNEWRGRNQLRVTLVATEGSARRSSPSRGLDDAGRQVESLSGPIDGAITLRTAG